MPFMPVNYYFLWQSVIVALIVGIAILLSGQEDI